MAANIQGFDANDHPDAPSFEPLPTGEYRAIIVESEAVNNKAGTGVRLKLKWKIVEGDFKDRIVFDDLNYTHQNADCQKLGRAKLGCICRAVKVRSPSSTEQLHGRPCMITVKVVPHYKNPGEFENEVPLDGYRADNASAPPVQFNPHQHAQPQPVPAAPQQQVQYQQPPVDQPPTFQGHQLPDAIPYNPPQQAPPVQQAPPQQAPPAQAGGDDFNW